MDLPPSYSQVTTSNINFNSTNPDENYTYVDFAPMCTEGSGLLSSAKYETFSHLTIRANYWLNANPQYSVEGCETIGIAPSKCGTVGEVVNTQETRYQTYLTTHGTGNNRRRATNIDVIKCLRLYIRSKRGDECPEPQQIGYLNVSPQLISPSGIFSLAKYDTYDQTLKDLNEHLDKNPVPGKIISIEGVTILRDSNVIDVDGSVYRESSRFSNSMSTMLRIFYIGGPPLYEKIGSADFRPEIVKAGGIFSTHQFQTLLETMRNVNSWLSSQTQCRITNFQTLNINYQKALKPSITERIDYMLPKHSLRLIFNIIRVFYVTGPYSRLERPINLSCKIFIPAVLVTKTIGTDVYETLDALYTREISPFIKYNSHARIINSEVVPFNPMENQESMSNYKTGQLSSLMVATVRIYFDGFINDPPIGLIQPRPVPIHEGVDCCTIL